MKKIVLAVTLICALVNIQAQTSPYSSEFFLLVKDNGSYTVSFDDQIAGSSLHRFRFFDIQPGKSLLTITYNNRQVFRDYITITPNSRIVAAYGRQGLTITDVLKISVDGRYNLDNWNTVLSQTGGTSFPGNQGEDRWRGRRNEEMSQQDFSYLYLSIKKEPFDEGKIKVFKTALAHNAITVDQLCTVLKMITFEDKRLDCALNAYDRITDYRNFYRVRDQFTFNSSKEKFDQAMTGK